MTNKNPQAAHISPNNSYQGTKGETLKGTLRVMTLYKGYIRVIQGIRIRGPFKGSLLLSLNLKPPWNPIVRPMSGFGSFWLFGVKGSGEPFPLNPKHYKHQTQKALNHTPLTRKIPKNVGVWHPRLLDFRITYKVTLVLSSLKADRSLS